MPPVKYTLPTFLFFSLCGFYFIIFQMGASKAPDRFLDVHKASHVPLDLTGGRIPLLDSFLRPLISFFVSAFADTSSPSYATVVAFVWSFSSPIQLPLVESLREQPTHLNACARKESRLSKIASVALSQPMLWGIFYQRLSGGWIIPLWLFFFLYARTRVSAAPVPRMQAESALVGWWLGHTLPALIMLIPNQPALCAVPFWVAFPILMSVFQHAYLYLRKRYSGMFRRARETMTSIGIGEEPTVESGYIPLQLTYASAMVASLVGHVHIVLIPALRAASSYVPTPNVVIDKDIGLLQTLRSFFFAVFTGRAFGLLPPTPSETTAASGVAHFVECDVLVVFSAVWVALLWDLAMRRRRSWSRCCRSPMSSSSELTEKQKMSTKSWLASMVFALVVGGLLLSPGAVTGALMMYRESILEEIRRKREEAMGEARNLEDAKSSDDDSEKTKQMCQGPKRAMSL